MEKIICAAVWFKSDTFYEGQPLNINGGFVALGRRHTDCYTVLTVLSKVFDANPEYAPLMIAATRDCQGFITTKNRYVDRKEAWVIAQKAGQIIHGPSTDSNDPEMNQLISENLYDDE